MVDLVTLIVDLFIYIVAALAANEISVVILIIETSVAVVTSST